MFDVPNLSLLSAIAAAAIPCAIWRLIQVRRSYRDLPKPPHSFLWGHLKLFGEIRAAFPPNTHPQYFYTEIAHRYSMPDVWYLDMWPFGPAMVIVTGPDAAVEVSVAKVYPIHRWVSHFLNLFFGPNVIAGTNGAVWKSLHHMMGPSFTPMAVKSHVATMAGHFTIFHQKLKALAATGEEFSMAEVTSMAVFDVISTIVLGFSLRAQQNGSPLLEDFKTTFTLSSPYMSSFNPFKKLAMWWTMRGARERSERYIHAKLQERFDQLRGEEHLPAQKSARLSIMDRMIVQRIEEMGDRVSLAPSWLELVTPNLKGLLAGGQGTTADTICHAFMLLSLHPDVMQRLREEHDRVFGRDLATTLDLLHTTPSKTNELEYTSAIIKETLRLFPVGFNLREAPEGRTTLETNNGKTYSIADRVIVCCPQTDHYNPAYFPEPTRFIPDRFLESYQPRPHRYAWRPFERGPRACMGQELAMDEMRIVLLLTARWFDFEMVVPDNAVLPKESTMRFSDWETRIGRLAYQELRMSAAPRDGMPMRVRLSGRR